MASFRAFESCPARQQAPKYFQNYRSVEPLPAMVRKDQARAGTGCKQQGAGAGKSWGQSNQRTPVHRPSIEARWRQLDLSALKVGPDAISLPDRRRCFLAESHLAGAGAAVAAAAAGACHGFPRPATILMGVSKLCWGSRGSQRLACMTVCSCEAPSCPGLYRSARLRPSRPAEPSETVLTTFHDTYEHGLPQECTLVSHTHQPPHSTPHTRTQAGKGVPGQAGAAGGGQPDQPGGGSEDADQPGHDL